VPATASASDPAASRSDPPTVRILTDGAAVPVPTGQRTAAGSPGDESPPAGDQPSSGAASRGLAPYSGDDEPPASIPDDAAGRAPGDAHAPSGAQPTVNLAGRGPVRAPDETVVLHLEPTVDLTSRPVRERRPEQERQPR
jgi:hypothetical protein